MSPWRLTPMQANCMDAYIETGTRKLAADKLGISVRTLEYHIALVREKMGLRSQISHYIAWDRWRRSAAQQENIETESEMA